MPPETEPEPFSRRLRTAVRAQRAIISEVVLALGLVLAVLAIGDFTPLKNAFPFSAIDPSTDTPSANYDLVFVIAGPIISIIGAWLTGTYFHARRRFDHLMLTKSKAEFLRNISEVEELLWDLTPADELRYQQKLGELRLRR